MTLEDFKLKWSEEIEKGIVDYIESNDTFVASRWDGSDIICERPLFNKILADLRKMGYKCISMFGGVYGKDFSKESMETVYYQVLLGS